MPAILDYVLKLSICLAAVYLFYQLFLRRLTFYNWNRWYLLGYAALSFIIPLIDIMPQLQKRELGRNVVLQFIPAWEAHAAEKNFSETLNYWDWILILLAIGTAIFLIRFLIRIISYLLMKKKAILISHEQTRLYQLNENIAPFSFGNSIFINSNLHSEAELQEIIRHEFVHIKQKHSVDILFAEILCILNWFNPFAWFIRNSIKQNLEFIADNKVVQNGFDKKEYQYLLLKVMGNNQFSFTHHFNFLNLKKRIAMMNSLKTAKVHLIKFLFLIPVIAVLLLSFRKEMKNNHAEIKLHETFSSDTIPEKNTIIIKKYGTKGNDTLKANKVIVKQYDNKKNADSVVVFTTFIYTPEQTGEKYDTMYIKKHKQSFEKKYDSVVHVIAQYKTDPFSENVLYIIDGKPASKTELEQIKKDEIKSINVQKNEATKVVYGEKAANGVIFITTKKENNGGSENNSDTIQLRKITENAGFKGTAENIKVFRDNRKEKIDTVILNDVFVIHGDKNFSIANGKNPLIIVDGKEITQEKMSKLNANDIDSITVFKDKNAIEKYGEKATNGVIEIKMKSKVIKL
jgi:beta-lactamase regulating signal transducer with metallopeptidase domain